MSQHIRAVAMRLPPEHASLTVEGLEQLTNITKLAMEAVNAMNTHGHTPSELVAIIRELRGYIQGRTPDCYGNKEKILTKTEDFA